MLLIAFLLCEGGGADVNVCLASLSLALDRNPRIQSNRIVSILSLVHTNVRVRENFRNFCYSRFDTRFFRINGGDEIDNRTGGDDYVSNEETIKGVCHAIRYAQAHGIVIRIIMFHSFDYK